MLCVKGRFGTSFVHHPDRLTQPLIRRDGKLQPATWDEALDLVAAKLVEHRGSFAALASAKGTNEDGYVFQKFVRLLMGTNNIDHCSRLCHGPSVKAMMLQIGSGATSNSYEDYENAGCLMVVGSDTSSNHPVIASRLRRAIDTRGTKLIVVNPTRIDLCNYTDLWLRPNPGTDVAIFNSIAHAILDEHLEDDAFIAARTEGFEAWRDSLAAYKPEDAELVGTTPEPGTRRTLKRWAAAC
jgi:predicted molibdopterin-dependent oxidoreductase YjgC